MASEVINIEAYINAMSSKNSSICKEFCWLTKPSRVFILLLKDYFRVVNPSNVWTGFGFLQESVQ